MRSISDDRCAIFSSLIPEPKTKEFDVGRADMANLRLILVDLQEQLTFDERLDFLKRVVRRLLAAAENHHVVGIPDETMPSAHEFLIELVQQDIGKHRAYRTALGRSYFSCFHLAVNGYRGS